MNNPTDYGWKRTTEFSSFFNAWWGSDNELNVNGVLDLDVLTGVDSSIAVNRGIFIRKEFADFYARLEMADREKSGGHVVSGSPGIGKSVFLLYALARRLKERRITLFFTSDEALFLFHAGGPYKFDGVLRPRHHLMPLMPDDDTRVWSLIDAGKDRTRASCPPFQLTNPILLFAVHAASPYRQHYAEWTKQFGGVRFIMNPWTEDELHLALKLYPHSCCSNLSEHDIREALKTYGPCIRDIVEGLCDPQSSAKAIQEALAKVKDTDHLIGLTVASREIARMDTNSDVCHRLFYLHRASSMDSTSRDTVLVEAKTFDIAEQLMTHCDRFELDQVRRLSHLCSPFPETSIFAGYIFVKLVIQHIIGAPPTSASLGVPRPLRGLYPMKALRESSTELGSGPSFVHSSSPDDKTGLRVEPGGVTMHHQNQDTLPDTFRVLRPLPAHAQVLPIGPRKLAALEDLLSHDHDSEDRHISYDHLYIPKTRNHPLFDAAFITKPQGHHSTTSTLWILQTTISARLGGRGSSSSGYDVVRALRSKVTSTTTSSLKPRHRHSCTIKYVLVVPQRHEQTVIWTMPLGWRDDVKGDVYIQFVDMDRLYDT